MFTPASHRRDRRPIASVRKEMPEVASVDLIGRPQQTAKRTKRGSHLTCRLCRLSDNAEASTRSGDDDIPLLIRCTSETKAAGRRPSLGDQSYDLECCSHAEPV